MKFSIKELKTWGYITFGSAITAFGTEVFLAKNSLAAGGVSGLATAINHLIPIPIGVLVLIFNVPIFALGFWHEGKGFGFKSIYSTIVLSLFLDAFAYVPKLTNDLLLAAIFGGVLSGVGLGLVFAQQATTGGTDVIAKVFNSFFKYITVGRILLALDLTVIAIATVIFHDFKTGLYSIVALYISSKSIDALLEGIDFAKMAFIISDEYLSISKSITTELVRGATILTGIGGYSRKTKNTIICTLRTREIPKLKQLVYKYDKNAFVIVADVREVLGEGFKKSSY